MFKTKNNKIELVCNSPSDGLIELFPIEKGILPEFFKRLPRSDLNDQRSSNVRTCTGLTDLYSNSFQILAWQDMKITIDTYGNVSIDGPQQQWTGVSHSLESQASGAWPGFINVKLACPWLLECNKDVTWTMIQPVWSQKNPLNRIIVPGSLEFKYQNQTNIHLLLPIPKDNEAVHYIKAGEALAMLTPNFQESYSIKLKYISPDEINRMLNKRWIFSWGIATYSKIRSVLRNKK